MVARTQARRSVRETVEPATSPSSQSSRRKRHGWGVRRLKSPKSRPSCMGRPPERPYHAYFQELILRVPDGIIELDSLQSVGSYGQTQILAVGLRPRRRNLRYPRLGPTRLSRPTPRNSSIGKTRFETPPSGNSRKHTTTVILTFGSACLHSCPQVFFLSA